MKTKGRSCSTPSGSPRRSRTRTSRGSWPSERARSRNAAGSPSVPRGPRGWSRSATGGRSPSTTAACSSGSTSGGRSEPSPRSGRAELGGGEPGDELGDVIVSPRRDLERKRMADAVRDPHLRERQLFAPPSVGRGDHPVLVAPQDERGDLAELGQPTVDPYAPLLATGEERTRLVPAPGLVGPDDRARGERARACPRPVPDKPRDESGVIATATPHEEAAYRRRPQHARSEEGAAEEWDAVQLVDPVQRDAEPDRRDKDEAAHELGSADGEVHRDAATERVSKDERGRDPELRDDTGDVLGKLDDVRVGGFERGPDCEAGKVDDVDGPSQPAESPDLWRQRAPVGGDSRKDDGMRCCAAAPGRDAEAVSLTRGHLHPHAPKNCKG